MLKYSSLARLVAFSALALVVPYGCSSTASSAIIDDDAGDTDGSAVSGEDARAGKDGSRPMTDAEAADDATTTIDGSVKDAALDGNLPDGAVADAGHDSGHDSGVDAGQDAGHDSGPGPGPDSGPDAGVCTPGSVSSFVPVFKPPTAFGQGVCTGAQITNFYNYCLGPSSTNIDCNNWVTSNPTCDSCLLQGQAQPSYGPLVILPNGFVQLNVAGCVYNANAADHACAISYQAQQQCDNAACEPSCNDADNDTFAACENNALTGACSAYSAAAGCADTIASSGLDPAAPCFAGASFQERYTTLATAFCSAPP